MTPVCTQARPGFTVSGTIVVHTCSDSNIALNIKQDRVIFLRFLKDSIGCLALLLACSAGVFLASERSICVAAILDFLKQRKVRERNKFLPRGGR